MDFLPPGLFKTLIDLWNTFRYTFVGILEWFVSTSVDLTILGVGKVSLLSAIIGSMLTLILGFRIFKFITKK